MKKKFTLISLFVALFATIGLTGCVGGSVGQKFIEQKPSVSFVEKDTLHVALMNKGTGKIADTFEGKASIVKIYFESLTDDVNVVMIDQIYTKKGDSSYNPPFVTFVAPTVYEETGYPVENFTGAYYQDTYAMLFDIDLTTAMADEKFDFVKNDKFVKMTVELYKGYEDAIQIKASYDFYLENTEENYVIMNQCTASFCRTKTETIIFTVFSGYKLADFEGYVLDQRSKLDGLTKTWYLYGDKKIDDIFEYDFPKEDLGSGITIYAFTLSKSASSTSGE